MKHPNQIKSVKDSERCEGKISEAIGTRSIDKRDNAKCLLECLTLGSREIEDGRFRSAAEVFVELDRRDDK